MPLLDSPPDLYTQIKNGQVRVNQRSLPICRFWKYVNKDGPIHPVHGQCWVWTGSTHRDGYGLFGVCYKLLKAHRFSYEEFIGPISYELQVLHKCDNPPCIRPEHLFIGTNTENIFDKVDKGRHAKGETSRQSQLTEDNVREIRRRYRHRAYGRSIASRLAEEFGVTSDSIWRIAVGRTWKHVV